MAVVDKLPVKGGTPEEQNGLLAGHIGDKSYRIEKIERKPPTAAGGSQAQEWIIYGES